MLVNNKSIRQVLVLTLKGEKMCKHIESISDNGNSWCVDCGTATGTIFNIEDYLEENNG